MSIKRKEYLQSLSPYHSGILLGHGEAFFAKFTLGFFDITNDRLINSVSMTDSCGDNITSPT